MKVVFDTNIYVSALAVRGGQAERALRYIVDGRDRLFVSRPIILELLRILSEKFGHDREQIARVAVFVAEIAELVQPRARVSVLADDPDNRILECAMAARVDAVVTGDRAMLALGAYEGVRVITLKEYLERPRGAE